MQGFHSSVIAVTAGMRHRSLLDGGAPFYRCYSTSDGKAIAVGPLEPKFYAQFLSTLGLNQIDPDEQYRKDQWMLQQALFAKTFASHTQSHWVKCFDGSDCCVTPVLSFDEATEHQHHCSRNSYVTVNNIMQAAPVPRFSRSTHAIPKGPVGTDAHFREILTELGLSSEAIQVLIDENTVLTNPC